MKFLVIALLITLANALPGHRELPGRGAHIIGGVEANEGEFPFIVSLQTSSGFHFCGGSIYNEEYVITAAHCVIGNGPSSQVVVVGEHDFSVDSPNQKTVEVAAVITHAEYSNRDLTNDIALLKLSEPLQFNQFISSVNVPESGESITGDVTIAGWGTTISGVGSSSPDIVHKAVVPIVDDDTCQDAYTGYLIADSMICAGYAEGGKDSCQGDSGGPMVANGNVLTGVVSWGIGCAEPGYYGVYTEVSHFIDWINDNTV